MCIGRHDLMRWGKKVPPREINTYVRYLSPWIALRVSLTCSQTLESKIIFSISTVRIFNKKFEYKSFCAVLLTAEFFSIFPYFRSKSLSFCLAAKKKKKNVNRLAFTPAQQHCLYIQSTDARPSLIHETTSCVYPSNTRKKTKWKSIKSNAKCVHIQHARLLKWF